MLLDLFGAITSLLATYYFIRLDNKAWVVTLIATCLNGILYWQKGIYADMVLESLYFLSACYRWYQWHKPLKHMALYRLSQKEWILLGLTILSGFLIIATLLSSYTNSQVVMLDALTTSLSLAAQALMCHKAIATWFLWFVTDALYVYLYFHKQLPFHSLLMLFYTGMALVGYLTWARQARFDSASESDSLIYLLRNFLGNKS